MIPKFSDYVRIIACLLVCILGTFGAGAVMAHAPGEHYIWLKSNEAGVAGEIEINVTDSGAIDGVKLDAEKPLVNQDLLPYAEAIKKYVSARFSIDGPDGPLKLSYGDVSARSFEEGNYIKIPFTTDGGRDAGRNITVNNTLLFETDARHRGILLVLENTAGEKAPAGDIALVFTESSATQQMNIDEPQGLLGRMQLLWQGVIHIWFGFDHVLFLLSLLLTAVLVRAGGGWRPATGFRPALFKVLGIVTLFTIAHSITLLLAGLDYISLPSRFVESIIALSIIVVALSNIVGRFDAQKIWIILGFGLFHGLGFASVMSVLPFRMENLVSVVLYFNLGVELGQIAIVAVAFPLLFLARKTSWYVPVVVKGGSIALALIATFWLFERVLG